MKLAEKLTLDEERALYGARNTKIKDCIFDGPQDGESALKECRNISVEGCTFALRYPLWHVTGAEIVNSKMKDTCRAPLWYSKKLDIKNAVINGVKALRECRNVSITSSYIVSQEFGWMCKGLWVKDASLEAEYPFFQSRDITLDNFSLKGKYSFQYVKNVTIKYSYLDTKDAFWHAKNVTVYDSVIKGEYLGWYSENLRLVRCRIEGTQPLCYAKGLILEDCEMTGCDLSFERSCVNATVIGNIESIKNPLSGKISADSYGEIILDGDVKSSCVIK